MNFIENVKSGVSAAVGTISDAAQNLIEKNRVNARVNRLKLVIKNETSTLDKAYTQLGKYYFENADEPKREEVENLFEIISNSKARLKVAQDLYHSTVQKQAAEAVSESEESAEPFVDTITVACSNEESYEKTEAEAREALENEIAEEIEDAIEEEISEAEDDEKDAF